LKRKKKVKKKKKGNSPMDSSLSDIYETSDRICNSVSMYRKEQQDKFSHENDYITCGLVKKWTASEEMKVSDKMKECKDSFRFKPDHAKEGVISNAAFLMAPFHFVCDQIERSETCLYLSAFWQMFTMSCIALILQNVLGCWKCCARTNQMAI
jgi:hypothetical protein